MGQRQKQKPGASHPAEQAIHDQEVLRATKELAAYFKGQRTEREARAALKIIKAFVRNREEIDPKSRPPLPGLGPARPPKTAKKVKKKKVKKLPGNIDVPVEPEVERGKDEGS